MNAEEVKAFHNIPKNVRNLAYDIAYEASNVFAQPDMQYIDALEVLKEKHGGVVWNSGGNCMLLSIPQGQHGLTHRSICISDDVVCILKGDNAEDAMSPPDETGIEYTFYLY